jgi:hypothetical protein
MANNLNKNPMYVDTAATLIAYGKPYTIRMIQYQATTDDHDVELQDSFGVRVWSAKVGDVSASGYNTESWMEYTGNQGLVCNVIDGGVLLVYLA